MNKEQINPKNIFWDWTNEKDESDDKGTVLVIDGVISQSQSWFGDDVTPKEFRKQLKAREGKDITVKINSPGGDAFAGVTIYNDLMDHDGNVEVQVMGMAASVASVIAMAGDEIVMRPGSMMMIHNPWGGTIGEAEDMEKYAKFLRQIKDSVIDIYEARTELGSNKISEMMDEETWFTAEEAVNLGFADKVAKAKGRKKEESPVEQMSTAFSSLFNGKQSFAMNFSKKSFKDFVGKIDLKDSNAVLEEIKNMGKTRKDSSEMNEEVKHEAEAPVEAPAEETKVEETEVVEAEVVEEAKAEVAETQAEEPADETEQPAESADMATLTAKVEALIAENKSLKEQVANLEQAQSSYSQQAQNLVGLLKTVERVSKPAESVAMTANTEDSYLSALKKGLKG